MSGPSSGAAIARSFRFLRDVRGWRRIAQRIGGRSGAFVVENDGIRFAGDMASFVDRQIYLFGDYERENIRLFLQACPKRGVILDIGANAGTHSLAFARAFDKVHAFEPNALLWEQFCRNMALNEARNVELHRIGLSDVSAELQLYDVDNDNQALGTFATIEQYDLPLTPLAKARVEIFDDYLPDLGVDAVKIDVQGLEPNVLRGMRRMLARDRPVVWAEFGSATLSEVATRAQLRALFPYEVAIRRFEGHSVGLVRKGVTLDPYAGEAIGLGDYVISPVA